ncbi:MAG TPA: uroporphyrinogen decarboxylase family protein [Planctomycetota bacterium]|jgi:hypothetical protein
MTPHDRFRETMRFGQPDRVPWLEEGLRDEVLARWREQGLPPVAHTSIHPVTGTLLSPSAELSQMFHYDRRERIELDLKPKGGLPPDLTDIAELRRRLDPNDPARWPADWHQRVEAWRHRDHILELPLHSGLFLTFGVGNWASLEPLLYLLADSPTLARNIMDAHAALIAAMAERVLSEVEIDFASFSEPIGGSHGPLVSPNMYKEIVLESYRPIFDVLHRHNVETIVFMTYANATCLLPDVLAAGFNCLWAMETETHAMDYQALRRRFGKDLRLIGGIDLDSLQLSDKEFEQHVLSSVPELLAQGGFIPLADGRVRSNIPFAGYVRYRRLLERLTERSGPAPQP